MVLPLSQTNHSAFPSPKQGENKFGPPRAKRYGKATSAISSKQAKPYELAADRAVALNIDFVFVSITWTLTPRSGMDDLVNVMWLREAVRKWLGQSNRGVTYYDLGVREIGDQKGAHWHWLVHCPAHLRGMKPGQLGHYIHYVLLPHSLAGGVEVSTKKYREGCEGCGRDLNLQHLARCYFLKGGTDAVRQRNGIDLCAAANPDRYAQDQGTFTGKRLFHSRSLGAKANRVRVGGSCV